MIVRTLTELDGTERDVRAETWRSRRFVLSREGVGFSFHDTVLYAGTDTSMWYANHIEAVYCVGVSSSTMAPANIPVWRCVAWRRMKPTCSSST